MKFTIITAFVASLFGCVRKAPPVDGPGMEYIDRDYRTEYANAIDFDSAPTGTYFAVAFMGVGESAKKGRNEYIKKVFDTLSDTATDEIEHIECEGDKWFLVIPRYREYVDILNNDTNEKHTVHNGKAFTVNCNGSETESNILIRTESRGGQEFCPLTDSDGKLNVPDCVWDITVYE